MNNELYRAVRDQLETANIAQAVNELTSYASHALTNTTEALNLVCNEMCKPSVLYRPTLTQDGNAWIALYGEDLAVGLAGYGDTPEQAMLAFDKVWVTKL